MKTKREQADDLLILLTEHAFGPSEKARIND